MNRTTTSKINGKAQIFLGLLVFGLVFAIAENASAQSSSDINNRLSRMENELDTLGRAVYKGEQPPASEMPQSSGGSSAADTEVRIQGFESEIRELTGRVEQQDYQIRQLKEQIDKLTSDIDVRLGGGAGSGGSMNGGFTNNPIHSNPGDSDGGMQYQNRSSTTTPPQPATPANDTSGGYQWKSGSAADMGGQLGTLNETSSGAVSGSADSAASLYESAFSLLKSAQYDEAEKEFKSFLSQYPGHALTGNATYWLGETYYVRGQFDKAAKTFAEGYQKDPKGPKAADNLLKMGMSLSGLNKKADACTALGQIEKQFPTSAAPVLRRAQQEMTRLGC